jgi:hypothetical protein
MFAQTSTTIAITTTTVVDSADNSAADSSVLSLALFILIAVLAVSSATLVERWWPFKKRWQVFVVILLLVGIPMNIAFVILINDTDKIGTLADWFGVIGSIVVGVLAAFFAYLAWRASERATKAEEKAAALAEATLNQDVRLDIARHSVQPGLTVFRLTLLDDSPTIWIREAEGGFRPRNDTPEVEMTTLNDGLQTLLNYDVTQGAHVDIPWNHADSEYEFSDWSDRRIAGIVFYIGFTVTHHSDATPFHRELVWHSPLPS